MKKTESPNDEGPIIVALGPGEEGAALIEAAEAIARSEGRALECLTVDDGGIMPGGTIARLAENRDLARSLGAAVSVLPGIDVARGLLDYARSRAASAIVVGRSGSGKKRYGIATRLLEAKRSFSVIEIGRPGQNSTKRERERYFPSDESSMHYFAAFLMVAGMTILNLGLASYAGYWAAAILYLAAISLGAIWLEPIPILFAALLSAIAWDFLFIPPRFTLTISRPEDVFMLALYLLVSLCSGLMTSRLRASERLLREQRMKLDRINSLALSLVGTASSSEILARGVESIEEATKCEVIAILRGAEGKTTRRSRKRMGATRRKTRDRPQPAASKRGRSPGGSPTFSPPQNGTSYPWNPPRAGSVSSGSGLRTTRNGTRRWRPT